jgi:tryptophanyl-tRNA synthetase
MGKTLGNAIYLSDPEDVVVAKIKKMYTDPNHLRVEDPGQVKGNPVFTYLDAFGDDFNKIAEMKAHYQKGGLGDMTVKKYLIEVMQAFLAPIREKRVHFAKDPASVMKLLQKGNEKANERSEETLSLVKEAMKINYF